MRTFEMKPTSRFWNIERQNKKVTISYGKVGGKPTNRSTTYNSPIDAINRFKEQIAEKLQAGYVETTHDNLAPLDPTGKALYSAIVENLDDLTNVMAFADWLSEQPDPRHQVRGEFIRVQLQLENESLSTKDRKALKKREKELLAVYERSWLGWRLADAVFDGGSSQFTFAFAKPEESREYRRGFLDRLTINVLTDGIALALLDSPMVRTLRRLILENSSLDHNSVRTMAASSALENLRVLWINDIGETDDQLTPFIAKLPRLEELHLEAIELEIGNLFALRTLGNLRSLHVAYAIEYDIEALVENPALSKLERLELVPDLALPEDGAPLVFDDVMAVAQSKHLKSLKHLRLERTDAGDAGLRALIESGMLGRLKSLDLSNGCITDQGARELAAAEGFANLEALTLVYNRLSSRGISRLRREGLKLNAKNQQQRVDGEYPDDYIIDEWDYFDDDFDDFDDWDDDFDDEDWD